MLTQEIPFFKLELIEYPTRQVETLVLQASSQLIVEALGNAIVGHLGTQIAYNQKMGTNQETSWSVCVEEITIPSRYEGIKV